MKSTALKVAGWSGLFIAFIHFFLLRPVVSGEINGGMRTWTRNLFDPEKKPIETNYSDLYSHLTQLLNIRDASDDRMMIVIGILIVALSSTFLMWSKDLKLKPEKGA